MKKFKRVYIEITNTCNLNCSFCPPTKRAGAFMELEAFERILDKIKGYSQYLYFHVKGEPLLHPELKGFLEMSFEKGFKVNITTNGTRLHELKELLLTQPAIRQINISLQSFEHQPDSLQKEYMEQVLQFVKEARERTQIIIELRLWNLELEKVEDPAYGRNHELLKCIEQGLQLPKELQETLSEGKGVKIADRIYLSQSYEFEWPDIKRPVISTKGFCYGLRQQIAILVDGTVVPCCLDSEGDLSLGNIFEVVSFEEIVDSSTATALVEGFSVREVVAPLCQRCGYRLRFDGVSEGFGANKD
ncbi:MAG: radical SAM protein, partial [Vallitaleaceae bacterium]|nr:radical SAM protein [Vallitaleaceae bacterium]